MSMKAKEVRKWVQEHQKDLADVEAQRKELESKDLNVLLSMVVLSDELLDRIKSLLVVEILRSRSLPDETILG